MTRLTVHFTGRVQGVGFRYTTANIAQRFNVTGYVMNLPDGRVKCVAEGTKPETAAFINDIKQALARNITHTQVDTTEAEPSFDTFQIRH